MARVCGQLAVAAAAAAVSATSFVSSLLILCSAMFEGMRDEG
jgi:hypothetical protein